MLTKYLCKLKFPLEDLCPMQNALPCCWNIWRKIQSKILKLHRKSDLTRPGTKFWHPKSQLPHRIKYTSHLFFTILCDWKGSSFAFSIVFSSILGVSSLEPRITTPIECLPLKVVCCPPVFCLECVTTSESDLE
jgi:hypothetical protein